MVVDETDQARSQCGSNLAMFGLAPRGEVVQVSAFAAYPQCDDYRRTCGMLQALDGGHYVVDLFRLTGGKSRHCTFTWWDNEACAYSAVRTSNQVPMLLLARAAFLPCELATSH